MLLRTGGTDPILFQQETNATRSNLPVGFPTRNIRPPPSHSHRAALIDASPPSRLNGPLRKIDTRDFQRATRTTSRDINRRIMLNLVRDHQPLSRADLARRMEIGRGVVT